MAKKVRKCCICGKELPKGDLGNNPEPVMPYSSGTCCSKCNIERVIPTRLLENARHEKILNNSFASNK